MLQMKKTVIFLLKILVLIYLAVQAQPSLQLGPVNSNNKCANGFYGPDCKNKCNASCSICDNEGVCLECSRAGVQLPGCVKVCQKGRYGQHCQSQCPRMCKDDGCDRVSGACKQCVVGESPSCALNCARRKNRESCRLHCPAKCFGWCNPSKKQCTLCAPGFKAPYCIEQCDMGTFGSQCNQNCSLRCKNKVCDHVTGECMGCNDGYVGRRCNGKCVQGRHGPGCHLRCSETCVDQLCHAETGSCVKCLSGYTGHLCDRLCESGWYGAGCSTACPSKCRWPCDPVTGECQECMAGYHGIMCNSTCAKGTYGINCNRTCPVGCMDNFCHHETGDCRWCKRFFQGPKCKHFVGRETRPIEIVIYSVMSLLAPLLFIAAAIACYKRNSAIENKSLIERVQNKGSGFISKPMQSRKSQARRSKMEIKVVRVASNISAQSIENRLKGNVRLNSSTNLSKDNAYPINDIKHFPVNWSPFYSDPSEDTEFRPIAFKGTKENSMSENKVSRIGREPTKPDGSIINLNHELSKQVQSRSPGNQTAVNPIGVCSSRESKLNITPYEQDHAHEREISNQIELVKGEATFEPLARASIKPVLGFVENHSDLKVKPKEYEDACQIVHAKQTDEMGSPSFLNQDPSSTERLASIEDIIDWQQAVSNSPFDSENGNVVSCPPQANTLPTKLRQKYTERASSVSSHANKTKTFRVVSSPSHINIFTPLPVSPRSTLTTQITVSAQPEWTPRGQSAQSSPLHNMSQLQHETTPSVQNLPHSKHIASPTQMNSQPQHVNEMSTQLHKSQSRGVLSQIPQAGPEAPSTTVSSHQNVMRSEHDLVSPIENSLESRNEETPLQHNEQQSQRILSASAQDMFQSPMNTPEEKKVVPLPRQNIPQSQLTSRSYLTQWRPTMSSELKHMSKSEHAMPSPPRPTLPTQYYTLSDHTKSKMSREQRVPSGPQSSSSLPPNNTLSSLPTMPMTSGSWSVQQHSGSNVYLRGKSSTLTNITSSETSDSGRNKNLPSTSTFGLQNSQDTEKIEMTKPTFRTVPVADSRALQQNNLIFNLNRRTDNVLQEENPISSETRKPYANRHPEAAKCHADTTQKVPDNGNKPSKPGNFSRRRAKSENKEPDEPPKPTRTQSRSPGLVRCATTRRQVQNVSPESRAGSSVNPLPTPPAQGRAILKPVHRLSRQQVKPSSTPSASAEAQTHSQSE
ncbi:multiple epidermal growth factor-like domains 11 [Elysia marginata]|uniref:Multiple epidermal growth factor-like domains 11 n=1 Tax=Elysia marginata TaxID=1093978 RepID=A0AAV4FQK1_9GAST|nr:multiple epidermal growth factor-like domains 11 [Elysia marginata]